MECIILAGGKGTRLANVIQDKPKCLADINGKPFLQYLLEYLELQGVHHVILSLGYQYEQVIDWLKGKAFLCKVSWVIEKESLGTGGAIKYALHKAKNQKVIIVNGDTMFRVDLRKVLDANRDYAATLAVKPMEHFDRYGSVVLDDRDEILAFEEKRHKESGLINGGIYVLNRKIENLESYPRVFSFEKDFLEKNIGNLNAVIQDAYFIDIGIPEDYARAQQEL